MIWGACGRLCIWILPQFLKKKGIAEREMDEIMTQSPQECAGVGGSELKRGCSMFRRTQACGLCTRIVVNVEPTIDTVIYCTQPSEVEKAVSAQTTQWCTKFCTMCTLTTSWDPRILKASICTMKRINAVKKKNKKKTPAHTTETKKKHNTGYKYTILLGGLGAFITIAAARPIPCAAADRTITFPSRRPMNLPLQLRPKQTKDPVFNRNTRYAFIMEDHLI